MIAVFLLFLISQVATNSPDSRIQEDIRFQIDRHLEGLVLERELEVNFWFLVQMSESTPYALSALNQRLSVWEEGSSPLVADCLLGELKDASDLTENRVSYLLERGESCTKSGELYIAALYEASPELRLRLLSPANQPAYLLSEPIFRAHVEKLAKTPFEADVLFALRSFRLSDYYIFEEYASSSSPANPHRGLVERWKNELFEKSRLSNPQDFLKLITVVSSYHAVDRNFAEVYPFIGLVRGNRNFSTIRAKHVLYKRLAYSASVYSLYQTALNFYRDDLMPLSKSIMETNDYQIVQLDYATILFRIGNIRDALTIFQDLYYSEHKIRETYYQSILLNNLAVSYLNAGRFDQYLNLQLEAYKIAEMSGTVTSQLQILNNLFVYHKGNNDWDRALLYLEEAEKIAIQNNFINEQANIYVLRATYLRDNQNDSNSALSMLWQALSILDQQQNYQLYKSAMSEIARTYERINDLRSYVDTWRKLMELAEKRNDTQLLLESFSALSDMSFRTDEFKDSLNYFTEIEEFDLSTFEFRLRVRAENVLAQRAIQQRNIGKAISILSELCEEIIFNVRNSADIQSGAVRFEEGFVQTFQILVGLYISTGEDAKAIVLLDEIKNLNKSPFVNSSLLKSSILSEEEYLRDIHLSREIEEIRSIIRTASSNDKLELNNRLISLVAEKNQINNKILLNYTTEPLDLSSLQKSLRRNEQIISFNAIDSTLYISSIERSNIRLYSRTITEDITEFSESIIRALQQGNPNLTEMYRLYEFALQGVVSDRSKRLYIIPESFFYQIPVETLPVSRPAGPYSFGTTRYLIEDQSVTYYNSLSDILNERKSPTTQSRFKLDYLGIGISSFSGVNSEVISSRNELSPLPFATLEIKESNTILRGLGERRTFLDEAGTKENFLNNAASTRIIHIASHSEVYPADPLFSVIHFNGKSSQNQVFAYELFDLDINSELIILSSCDSGGGTYVQGSGIIGLGRALKFAGANALLLNTWAIKDPTAYHLVTNFHRFLSQKKSKDTALQLAKVRYINEVNSNPAVWGSMILYGNHDPITRTPSIFNIIAYVSILGAIVYLILFGYRRYFM